MVDRLRVNRTELAKIFKDPRTLKAFEDLFITAKSDSETNPIEFQALNILVNTASSNAQQALGELESINQALQTLIAMDSNHEAREIVEDLKRLLESKIPFQPEPNNDLNYIDLNRFPNAGNQLARLRWDDTSDTLAIGHSGGVVQQVGEELYARVTNSTGSAFSSGDLIGLTGSGTAVGKYDASGTSPPIYAIGIATETIAAGGGRGRLTVYGRVNNLDTSSYVVGDTLYANPAVAGGLTKIKPTAPNVVLPIGVVTTVSATVGQIFVRPIFDQQMFYGAFAKTIDATPTAANTANAITMDTTVVSNGVVIDGTVTSRITVSNSGLYLFNVSFQLTSTNASVKNVYLWFRKNGVDVPNTTIIRSLESASAVTVQTRSAFFSMSATDYIELMWAADNTAVTLDARAATAFCPSAPAVTLTVNEIQP